MLSLTLVRIWSPAEKISQWFLPFTIKMSKLCRLNLDSVAFFQCDLHEELLSPAIKPVSVVFVAKMIAKAAHLLKLPFVVSELESKGPTVAEVRAAWETPPTCIVRREQASACTSEALAVLKGRKSVVLFGLEAHSAVLRTCLDLLAQGFDVHLLVDGISCRSPLTRSTALERMAQAGAVFETYGSVLTGLIDKDLMNHGELGMHLIKVRPTDPMPSL
jgi:hypothetical protein